MAGEPELHQLKNHGEAGHPLGAFGGAGPRIQCNLDLASSLGEGVREGLSFEGQLLMFCPIQRRRRSHPETRDFLRMTPRVSFAAPRVCKVPG